MAHAQHARLYTLIRNSMPADNPGGLSENNYANIVAYILQFNGVAAGTTPLTPTTDVRIGGPSPAPHRLLLRHVARLRQPLPRRRQQGEAQARKAQPQAVDADAGRSHHPPVSR